MYVCREIVKALHADGEFGEIRQAIESKELTESAINFLKSIQFECGSLIEQSSTGCRETT